MQYITLCLITIIHVSREQAKLFAVSTSCPIFIYLLYFQVDIFAMDLVVVPVHLGMHWCLAVRSHFTFSPRGIETALTVADSDLQIGGGGGGASGPPGLLLWIRHWPSKYKTYFDQHLYSLFRTGFFFSIPVKTPYEAV